MNVQGFRDGPETGGCFWLSGRTLKEISGHEKGAANHKIFEPL